MRPKKSTPKKGVVKEPVYCDYSQHRATYNANKKIRLTKLKEAPEPQVGGSISAENGAPGTSAGKPEKNVKGDTEAAAPEPRPENPVEEAPGEGGEVSASKAM